MKSRLIVFTAFLLTASHALAQAPPKPPKPPAPALAAPAPPAAAVPAAPPPPPAPPAPAPAGSRQSINIKVDLTIGEEGGTAPAVKKTVSTVAGDGFSGSVRETTTGNPGVPPVVLNVDATPVILSNGKIRVAFNIQYVAGGTVSSGEGRVRTDIRQSLVLVVENGKTLKISDATDPISDRRVSVEVTATILK